MEHVAYQDCISVQYFGAHGGQPASNEQFSVSCGRFGRKLRRFSHSWLPCPFNLERDCSSYQERKHHVRSPR